MKIKFIINNIFLLLFFISFSAKAQDPMEGLCQQMRIWNAGTTPEERQQAGFAFIKQLVQYLKQPNSYYLPLDSLKNVSVLNAPDGTFRILTWGIKGHSGMWRHYGCIQWKGEALKLVSLADRSDELGPLEDTVLTPKTWFGAVYYGIVAHKMKGKKVYTLIGFDANEPFSQKKIIETMVIDKDKQIQFGASIIQKDSTGTFVCRKIFEYAPAVSMALRYEPTSKMIVAEHLIPPKRENEGQFFTYVPDGSLDGYKWKKGKWLLKYNVVVTK